MKKLFASVAVWGMLMAGGFMLAASPALAVDVLPICNNSTAQSTAVCQDKNNSKSGNPLFGPSSVISRVISILGSFIGFLSVLMIIAAGMRMITAGGDAAALKSARASLYQALGGLLIAALAEVIVGFVLNKL